jgi:hypothetical protein
VFQDFNKPVTVCGYDPMAPEMHALQTVSAALVYDFPDTGETILLIVHQAIHVPHLMHNLLSPMQLRLNDIQVNDMPKFLIEKPTLEDHAIIVPGDLDDDQLTIPLSLSGVTSSFPMWNPTIQEFEMLPCYEYTFELPEYEPSDDQYSKQEVFMATNLDRLLETGDRSQYQQLCSVSKSLSHAREMLQADNCDDLLLHEISATLTDRMFLKEMGESICISSISAISNKCIDATTLAHNWGIGLDTAK